MGFKVKSKIIACTIKSKSKKYILLLLLLLLLSLLLLLLLLLSCIQLKSQHTVLNHNEKTFLFIIILRHFSHVIIFLILF